LKPTIKILLLGRRIILNLVLTGYEGVKGSAGSGWVPFVDWFKYNNEIAGP